MRTHTEPEEDLDQVKPSVTAAELEEQLLADGLERGWPSWISTAAKRIDTRVIAEARCLECDQRGLDCHPFRCKEPRRYVLMAACPNCNHAFEC